MGFDTELQKEIWLKHIEVQERVLQLNSAPIAIEPDSIQIRDKDYDLIYAKQMNLITILSRVKALFNAAGMTTSMILMILSSVIVTLNLMLINYIN